MLLVVMVFCGVGYRLLLHTGCQMPAHKNVFLQLGLVGADVDLSLLTGLGAVPKFMPLLFAHVT